MDDRPITHKLLAWVQVMDRVLVSSITNAPKICCTVAADNLIVSSVSNWGGYALSAALALIAFEEGVFGSRLEALNACMPDAQQEQKLMEQIVEAGARDGVTTVVRKASRTATSSASFDQEH